eukprot:133347-Prorocentrum_lima.AAC.1
MFRCRTHETSSLLRSRTPMTSPQRLGAYAIARPERAGGVVDHGTSGDKSKCGRFSELRG